MKRFLRLYRHAKQLKQQKLIKRSPLLWAFKHWREGDDFVLPVFTMPPWANSYIWIGRVNKSGLSKNHGLD